MADTTASVRKTYSVGESSQLGKRKQPSTEVISSFGSLSEFGGLTNIGSSINGDQETKFLFGTSARAHESQGNHVSLTRSKYNILSPAPKPTSCCQSQGPLRLVGASSTSNFGTITSPTFVPSTSLPSRSDRGFKVRLFSESTTDSESNLPAKKRTLGQFNLSSSSMQPEDPTPKLTLGIGSTSPSGSLTTLSNGSMFSPNNVIPSLDNSQSGSFSSCSTRSSTLGNQVGPVASSDSGAQVLESRTAANTNEGKNCVSISAQPGFNGKSHEELRWESGQERYRGNCFAATSFSPPPPPLPTIMCCMFGLRSSFFQFPSFAFGSIPFVVPCHVLAASGQTNAQLDQIAASRQTNTQSDQLAASLRNQSNAQPYQISTPLLNQSNMVLFSVPSIEFGQQFFPGFPSPLSLNNGFGLGIGFGQPSIPAFPLSACLFPTSSNALPPAGPNSFGGN